MSVLLILTGLSATHFISCADAGSEAPTPERTDAHPTWDRELFEERVVVHEIGHQFELADGTGGIMEEDAEDWTSSFTEEHLKAIRSIESP